MRRLAAGFLAICTVLSISTVAKADEAVPLKSLDEIVNNWIDTQYQGDAEVSKVITLFEETNETGQNVGHLVTFEKDGSPAGYLVLNRSDIGNPVFKFAS